MKRISLKSFFWLTALVGCSGLLTATLQLAIAQTHSPVLLVQRLLLQMLAEGINFNEGIND